MITYELAKQLKDAGFPQKIRQGVFGYEWSEKLPDGNLWVNGMAYKPTLSELIEACGDRFSTLTKDFPGWRCWGKPNPEWDVQGSTPEEAVAKLYLNITKNKA